MMPAAMQRPALSLYDLLRDITVVDESLRTIVPAGLCLDSRQLLQDEVFVALRGHRAEALQYCRQALEAGATAVIHESPADDLTLNLMREHNVPHIHDAQLTQHLGEIASRYYRHPSARMKVVAITGTDGKTSVSHFIAQALDNMAGEGRRRAAVIGTVGSGFGGELREATLTTPDAISLQARLAELLDHGAAYVAMEASSQGLEQGRLNGTRVELAVLTNLGRDHLDYHGDIETYQRAKQRLFEWNDLNGAVLNWHDAFGQQLLKTYASRYPVSVYGLDAIDEMSRSDAADWVCGRQLECTREGLRMRVTMPDAEIDLECRLLGWFNALNVLAVAAALRRLGRTPEQIAGRLAQLHSVNGRMQLITRPGHAQTVIDYAHTPQALRSALSVLRGHCSGKLWCVFGCGGDRDKGKRPEMGAIAETLADNVIITNDNPRHEAPERIAKHIQSGMRNRSGALVILDRAEAIVSALRQAAVSDLVLIAGKGHESSQQIGDEFLPFQDQAIIEQWLENNA